MIRRGGKMIEYNGKFGMKLTELWQVAIQEMTYIRISRVVAVMMLQRKKFACTETNSRARI